MVNMMEEMNKTIDNNLQDSTKWHIDVIAVSINDEEFEKEIVRLSVRLNMLMELVHNHKLGWIIKRIAKWRIK